MKNNDDNYTPPYTYFDSPHIVENNDVDQLPPHTDFILPLTPG